MPIGTSAASARIATKSVAVHDRTAKVSTVRRGAGDRRDQPGAAELGLDEEPAELRAELRARRSIAGLNASTKVRKPVAAAETVKIAAETDAASSADVELALARLAA